MTLGLSVAALDSFLTVHLGEGSLEEHGLCQRAWQVCVGCEAQGDWPLVQGAPWLCCSMWFFEFVFPLKVITSMVSPRHLV